MTPLLSIIIPTLNAGNVIVPCLQSILSQSIGDYEILIAEAGSTDSTLFEINKFKHFFEIRNSKLIVIPNPLKTAEAGKAVALVHAKGKYIALIDSDNILPDTNWLKTMLTPLESNPKLIGSEPYSFTYRPNSGFIERYSALLGANDPYAYIFGVSDRFSYLTGKFVTLPIEISDFPSYYQLTLRPDQPLPTLGANGTIFRTSFLKKIPIGDYLFDIDIITSHLAKTRHSLLFAKVKTSIIHTYCEASIAKFIRKQKRRACDHFSHQPLRSYHWHQDLTRHPLTDFSKLARQNLYFAIYSSTLVLPLFDAVKGYLKKPDLAWFFHPLACLLTFAIYTYYTVFHILGRKSTSSRDHWSQ